MVRFSIGSCGSTTCDGWPARKALPAPPADQRIGVALEITAGGRVSTLKHLMPSK
jgi:hypothetical protein